MTDIYEKENPLIFTVVEPNVGASEKDLKITDAEATVKITADVASSEVEKGNPSATLKYVVYESDRKLGLEDLNDVIDSTENMNVDDPKPKDDFIQPSPEKTDERKEVGPGVETSLGQQEKQGNDDDIISEDESGQKSGSDQGVPFKHTAEKSCHEEKKQLEGEQTEVESDLVEDVSVEKDEEDVVNVENINSDDIPQAKRDVESVANRLRSNKGKAVPSKVETPKTKTETVGVGSKKGWSKVKVKSTAGRTKKRKGVSTSELEYDVEEDVSNIIPSTSRKSVGKKIVQTVANVPIDKVSFHLPENAQRWRFIYHRRLAMERKLGKEAPEIEIVMEFIKEAGLMKTVCNLGDCYEKLVKEFLVNSSDDCEDPLSREFQKVFVRGEWVNFSPNIINKYHGVEEIDIPKLKVTD